MSKSITDRRILKAIHDRYYDDYCSFNSEDPERASRIYVPIDCNYIAEKLNTDPNIIFGRLYYHLDKKYGYKNDDGSKVHLFARKIGRDSNAVNFPLLAAVLAEHEQSYYRYLLPIILSLIAIFLSVISLFKDNIF